MTLTVAEQLADELGQRLVEPLGALVGPTAIALIEPHMHPAVGRASARLLDPEQRGDTATEILYALWGRAAPDPAWWRTALGRLCAGALADRSSTALTQQTAAEMLGVTRGTVSQLVHRGTLERHPDGGVLSSAVLHRLSR